MKADDLSETKPIVQPTQLASSETSTPVDSFVHEASPLESPPVTDSIAGGTAQQGWTDRETMTPKLESKTSEIPSTHSSSTPFSFSGFKDEDIIMQDNGPPSGNDDDDDDELPPIPPPPIPDMPPPDMMDLTPPMEHNKRVKKKPSFKTVLRERHSSIAQKEVWKKKSDVLEGAMSGPLPLFIQSKANENGEMAQQGSAFKDSSESLSSVPDSPPPTLPDSPPPLLPDSPPPMLPDGSHEDVFLEFSQTEKTGRSKEKDDLGPSPGLSTPSHLSDVLEQDASSNLESVKSRPLSLPDSPPPTHPKPPPHASLPDSAPPTLPESLPPTLPDSPPPTLPESLPPPPSTSVPELPISPLPNSSTSTDAERDLLSLSSSVNELIKTSTPRNQSSNDAQSRESLILAATPPSTSLSPDNPPSESHRKSPARSAQNTKLDGSSLDDFKSSSEPSLEPSQQDDGVQLRADKHFRPVEYRQSFPLAVNTHETVKVISHGSPPASPDLKFTRVSKKTWKHFKGHLDDLSSSASTGNVTEGTPARETSGRPTGSLRSLQSDDSFSLDRSHFLQKNQQAGGGATLSPLVAVSTSTPAHAPKKPAAADLGGGAEKQVSHAEPVGKSPVEDGVCEEQLKLRGPVKPRQLDIVRRETDRSKKSPINSFVLDSNLLDVSG